MPQKITTYDFMCSHCDFTISTKSEGSRKMLSKLHRKKCKKTGRTEEGEKRWDELDKRPFDDTCSLRGLKTKNKLIVESDELWLKKNGKILDGINAIIEMKKT